MKIPITNEFRSLILKGLHDTGTTHTQLGELLGKSKAWVTGLLDGRLKSLKDDDWDAICDHFKISYKVVDTAPWPVQFYTLKELVSRDPNRMNMVDAMIDMFQAQDDAQNSQ